MARLSIPLVACRGNTGDDDERNTVRSQCARDINGTTFSKTNIEQRAIERFLINSADGTTSSTNGTDYLEFIVLYGRRKMRSSDVVVLDDKDLPDTQVCPLQPRQ